MVSDYQQLNEDYLMRIFSRDLMIVKGQGSKVWDENGKEYIDCVAGIAVCSTGHCHPIVVKAICEQAQKLIHISNLYYVPGQAELGKRLVELTGLTGGRAFFANSGTEANEAAIKLARVRTGKSHFISFQEGFHGRSSGALALTHKVNYRQPFAPLQPECSFVPYGDEEAVKEAIRPDTAAIVMEGVQGEAGVIPSRKGFLAAIRDICDDTGCWMIMDEIQTGIGRTGKWFSYEHENILPDVVSMAKGMGSGFPMGAIVAREGLEFRPGEHGGTFNGGPIACAAGSATLKVVESVLSDVERKGQRFKNAINAENIRQTGLMIGVPVPEGTCTDIQKECQKNGVLVNCASGSIRLVPPLNISDDEIDFAAGVLNEALGTR